METGVLQPGQLPRPPSPSEPICLSDSLDEELGGAPSLDSISHALALLSSAAKGLIQNDGPASPEGPKPTGPTAVHPTATPLSKKTGQSGTAAAASPLPASSALFVTSSSPSVSRPSSVSLSSSPTVRGEVSAGMKAGPGVLSPAQRHSLMAAQRSAVAVGNKLSMPGTPSLAKPRPPPTSSPLLPPHKSFSSPVGKSPMSTPSNLHKSSNNNGVRIGDVGLTLPQSRPPSLPAPSASSASSSCSSSLHTAKSPQALHISQPKSVTTLTHSQPKPQHQQSNFITPMQATLTKSPHSSNSPILKLTPRVAPPSASPGSSTQSPTLRTNALPGVHQYSSKSPGFHSGFSGVGASFNSPVGQQKNSSQVNSGSLTSTPSSMAKPTQTSSLPVAGSANPGQRQRPAGGVSQGTKAMASVSSAAASQLPQVRVR